MPTPTGPTNPAGPIDLLATCTFGLEAVVVRELAQLGHDAKAVGTGRVHFRIEADDYRSICDANLWLRAADRVLIRVGQFDAGDFDALFEGVKGLPWERWIAREATMNVAGRCVRSQLMSEPAVQRTTKKALVERLQRVYGEDGLDALLPETGPPVAIEVSILKDVATLTIDTAGTGLHKRGYREGTPGQAPLKETLAAGLVLLSVWRPGRPLVDPFCGTGTIAIEAAMIGRCIAPGLNRSFDAEFWLKPGTSMVSGGDGRNRADGQDGEAGDRDGNEDAGGDRMAGNDESGGPRNETLIDPAIWHEAREEARSAIVPDRLDPVIHASDISEGALHLARLNARDAGVANDIQFLKRDVADLNTRMEYGVVVTNPPYGMRLGDEGDTDQLYRSLPAIFRRLPTWTFHILSGRLDLERLFGQDASRRRKLYNSKIECAYFTFLGPKPPSRKGAEVAEGGEDGSGGTVEGAAQLSATELEHLDPGETAQSGCDTEPQSDPVPLSPSVSFAPSAPLREIPPRDPPPREPTPPAPTFGGLRERDEREAAEFGRCLTNNLRHLRKYPSRAITCFRVYERDVPDVPLIVDRYEALSGEVSFHVAEYEREHSRTGAQQADWIELMQRTIARVAGVAPERVHVKAKHRQRGLTQHEKVAESRNTMVVQEGGLKFEVNLSDYIDTGLFLDHRLTRQMVRDQSAGKRLLNLFCYTGSFTVYAAAGGAASSTNVDLSNTYLDWARRNLGLNNLYSNAHKFVRSDVIEFLRGECANPRLGEPGHPRYDLAIVDPPTFSNSKSTREDWEVAASHGVLLGLLGPLMSPGGTVFFSTNFRRFKLDEHAASQAGFAAREITHRTIPPEYRNKRIHRCWRMVMVGKDAAVAELAARLAAAPDVERPQPADVDGDD